MAGKSSKLGKKLRFIEKNEVEKNTRTIDEQDTFLEIKKELNNSLKDLFEDYNIRISKLEALLINKDDNNSIDKPKTPEHCYN